jgi:hypothetical protein
MFLGFSFSSNINKKFKFKIFSAFYGAPALYQVDILTFFSLFQFLKSCTLNLKNRKLIICQSILSIIILVIAVSLSLTIGRQFEPPIIANGTASYAATLNVRIPTSGPNSGSSIYQIPLQYLTGNSYYSSTMGPMSNDRKFTFIDDTRGREGLSVGNSIPRGDENRNRVYDSLMSRVAQYVISIPSSSSSFSTERNISYLPVMEKTSGTIKDALELQAGTFYNSCVCYDVYPNSDSSKCYNFICSVDQSTVSVAGITFQEVTTGALRYSVTPVRLGSGYYYSGSDSLLQYMEVAQALHSAAYRIATNYTFSPSDPTCIINVTSAYRSPGNGPFDSSAPCDIPSIMTSTGVRHYNFAPLGFAVFSC